MADTKGGRFTLTINGVTYTGRGEATINPNRVGVTAAANMDGTAYRTIQPKLATLELTFDRGRRDIAWDDTMLLSDVAVTFVEDDYGKTHLFTNATWVGEGASINTASGEVTGLSIATDSYQGDLGSSVRPSLGEGAFLPDPDLCLALRHLSPELPSVAHRRINCAWFFGALVGDRHVVERLGGEAAVSKLPSDFRTPSQKL